MTSHFNENDLVMYKKGGQTYSAGFNINSVMLQYGISPITSLPSGDQTGGNNVSDLFNNLAIPAGLFYFNGLDKPQTGGEKHTYENKSIDDSLYSKLMDLNSDLDFEGGNVEEHNKHKQTKKKRGLISLPKQKKRKTKKHPPSEETLSG